MKLTVKTLKGSHFEIKIMAVKKNIEDVQGKDNYPCRQQLLIHNGKVLKDETTLRDCNVSEDGFLVVMLSKTAPALTPAPVPSSITPVQTQALAESPTSDAVATNSPTGTRTYDQATSNIVASDNREQTIQHILDIGGGNWDRETIIGALRAAYNNPERAVDYLYSGIPHTAELAVPVSQVGSNAAAPGAFNSSPLNIFPQESLSGGGSGGEGGLGSLDFLRNNQQFQPVLQEVGKQNPQLLRALG